MLTQFILLKYYTNKCINNPCIDTNTWVVLINDYFIHSAN
jgi:hypothetical protein